MNSMRLFRLLLQCPEVPNCAQSLHGRTASERACPSVSAQWSGANRVSTEWTAATKSTVATFASPRAGSLAEASAEAARGALERRMMEARAPPAFGLRPPRQLPANTPTRMTTSCRCCRHSMAAAPRARGNQLTAGPLPWRPSPAFNPSTTSKASNPPQRTTTRTQRHVAARVTGATTPTATATSRHHRLANAPAASSWTRPVSPTTTGWTARWPPAWAAGRAAAAWPPRPVLRAPSAPASARSRAGARRTRHGTAPA